MDWLESLEHVVHVAAEIGILLLESAGILVVLMATVKGVIGYFRKDPHIGLRLGQGISLGLGFMLGGEVLRTIIVRDWNDLAILGVIVVLRILLTVLLHWEIKQEEERYAECIQPIAPPPAP